MSVSDKINNALDEVLNEAINAKNVSKILSLLTDEILGLCEKNLSVKEQCEVINKAFNIDIKESAYSAFYYRNIKPLLSKKTSLKKEEFVENSSPQNKKKTSSKKEDKKVAPKEPIKEKVTIDNFEDYQVTKKSKYDKYLNKGKK